MSTNVQTDYTNYYSSSQSYSGGHGQTSCSSGSYSSGPSSSPPSSTGLVHVYGVCPIGPLAPGGIASTR